MTPRTLIISALLLTVGAVLGWLFAGGSSHDMAGAATGGDGPCAGGAQPLHWAAPMDPSYQRDAPGKSPMGMDLVPVCPGGGSPGGADVTIDPAIVQNLGLRTATVERRVLSRAIPAVGTVGYDENSFQMIHARAEGWLEKLWVESEGAAVKCGEPLYALFSPKLVAAEQEYLTARASGREALIQAAGERLAALGYSQAQIRTLRSRGKPALQLRRAAEADGVVAMLGVRDGQFIAPGTHMMTLASLDTVWVLVDLMERDAGMVHQGLPATASVDAYPGRQWHGRVDYIYPSLDAMTRTVKVRLVFDNSDGALRPNMFTRASIQTAALADALSVPAAAVIRSGRGARVVKRVGAGTFDVVSVRTGLRAGDVVQVLEGLAAGDEVVVSGQFLIDSEANLDAEALRLKAAVPRGQAVGVVRELDASAGTITLEHGPITPLGKNGLAMPGMTMPFELATDSLGVQPGDTVDVTISQATAGRYQVTMLHPHQDKNADGPAMGADAMPGSAAMDTRHDADAMGAESMDGTAMPMASGTMLTRGRVVAVDLDQRRITLEHEAIESMGMPAMTMPFPVAPSIDLNAVKAGDELTFGLDPQTMAVNQLEIKK